MSENCAVASPYYRGLTHRDDDFLEPNNAFHIPQQLEQLFKINFPSSNLLPLRENAGALSRNHGDELRIDVCQAAGEAAPTNDLIEAYIDIWDDNIDPTDRGITYQAWREYLDHRKRSRVDDRSVEMMSETAAALGGQTIGALVAVALANSAASSPVVYLVEFILLLGLICTLAGISLRGKRRAFSVMMSKIGVMATISAVIMSLAAHLPPVIMLTVGPVAFLILAAAVALA